MANEAEGGIPARDGMGKGDSGYSVRVPNFQTLCAGQILRARCLPHYEANKEQHEAEIESKANV